MLNQQLEYIKNLQEELQKTNLSTDKLSILKKYCNENHALFDKMMNYIYSYDKKYWITSKNVYKNWDKFSKENNFSDNDDLFKILDRLANREITGYKALNYFKDLLVFCNKKYENVLICILNKDLKANINTASINKISKCINEFNVSLANRYDEAPDMHKIDFSKHQYELSRKLDGIRMVTTMINGVINFYSRTGTNFLTLDLLKDDAKKTIDAISAKYGGNWVLDGEVCKLNDDGTDNFSGIMQEITKKNYQVKEFKYVLFDIIPYDEFINGKGNTPFKKRLNILEDINPEGFTKYINVVKHINNITKEQYDEWFKMSIEKKWEGLMIKDLASFYNGKRTYDIQKIKTFYDMEFKVYGVENGTKKMLIDNCMKELPCIKSLLIKFKGAIVNVGSGISDSQRLEWYKDNSLIIGKTITVQYFEETIDTKTKLPSLRFPTLKTVHGKTRTI